MVKTNPQGYPTEIFWSGEDEGFIALAPDLPGCSAWGETEIEALTELRDAIEAWQQAAQSAGNPVPLPSRRSGPNSYSGRFVARVPRSLHRQVAERAREEGISLNQYLVYLLTKALGDNKIVSPTSVSPAPQLGSSVYVMNVEVLCFSNTLTQSSHHQDYGVSQVIFGSPASSGTRLVAWHGGLNLPLIKVDEEAAISSLQDVG